MSVFMGYNFPPLLNYTSFDEYLWNLLKYLFGIFYSIGTVEFVPNCSPIWFLTSLFCANCFFYFYRKRTLKIYWIIPLLIIGYFSTIPSHLPQNMGSALIGSIFMWMGYLIKEENFQFTLLRSIGLLLVLAMNFYFIGFPIVDMDSNKYSNYFSFIITATVACLIIICLVRSHHFTWRLTKFESLWKNVTENSIAIFGYNYSINTIALFLLGAKGMTWWPVLFCVEVLLLALFVFVIKLLRIRKLFI